MMGLERRGQIQGDFRPALQQDLDLTWRWQGMVEKEKSRITPKSLPDFTCRRGKEVGLGGDFCLLDT